MDSEKNIPIKLTLSENKDISFTLSSKAAKLSKLIETQIIDYSEDNTQLEIPISDIDQITLERIVEYLKHFNGEQPASIEKPLKSVEMRDVIDEWSANFVDKLELDDLVNLTTGANILDIECLLDLTCAKLSSMVKDKTEEEIMNTFGIKDPLTQEEKDKILEENKWIDDNI